MESQMFTQNQESAKNTLRIKVLLDKLRNKINNFTVVNDQGQFLGEVKDIKIDSSRRLKLVISKIIADGSTHFFLLRSNRIKQVDSANRRLFVDLNPGEIENLPEYKGSQIPGFMPQTQGESQTDFMPSPTESISELEEIDQENAPEYEQTPDIIEDEVIRLLEERLVVDVSKQKVGEVIVRKEIITEIVEVPVRREILIVEQVSPERKQLAEIDLGQADTSEITKSESTTKDNQPTIQGKFHSLRTANLLLDAMAKYPNHGCKQVRLEIVLENGENQSLFQEWFNRCSGQ